MARWQVLLVEEVADWFADLTKNDPGQRTSLKTPSTDLPSTVPRSAARWWIGSAGPGTTT